MGRSPSTTTKHMLTNMYGVRWSQSEDVSDAESTDSVRLPSFDTAELINARVEYQHYTHHINQKNTEDDGCNKQDETSVDNRRTLRPSQ